MSTCSRVCYMALAACCSAPSEHPKREIVRCAHCTRRHVEAAIAAGASIRRLVLWHRSEPVSGGSPDVDVALHGNPC